MIIVHTYPPNIEDIRAVLDVSQKGIVYTVGDVIYNPDRGHIDPSLFVHESTHSKQQLTLGIEQWWKQYLQDPQFRLTQEVEAYQNQYKHYKKTIKDRNHVAKFLHTISSHLASIQYGNLVTLQEAKKLIQA